MGIKSRAYSDSHLGCLLSVQSGDMLLVVVE